MSLYHLTIATDGRTLLCKNEEERRWTVRALVRIALLELVLFCVVDEHLHAVLWGSLRRIGFLRSALTRSLQAHLEVPLQSSHLREVKTRAHLEWLVRYVLTQPSHHGLASPPALWTGSCFQDLLGARAIDGFQLRAREALPRLSLPAVCEMVGLKRLPAPLGDPALREAGAKRLQEAASAALCIGPGLAGRSSLECHARDAITVLGEGAGIATNDLAWVTGVTANGIRRHRGATVDDALLRAVRVRLALEQAVAPATR
jgi:hypothetical protein